MAESAVTASNCPIIIVPPPHPPKQETPPRRVRVFETASENESGHQSRGSAWLDRPAPHVPRRAPTMCRRHGRPFDNCAESPDVDNRALAMPPAAAAVPRIARIDNDRS